jgi:hypothetical protein
MEDPRTRLARDSLALLTAAEQLRLGAGDRAGATALPVALDRIAQSLHALSRGCDGAARALIPPGEPDERIARRYARAAADWPGGLEEPSHERQAQLLASIHETAAALRSAAASCARTGRLVSATMERPAAERRSATPAAA